MKIIYDFLKPSRDYLTEDYLVDSDNELLYIVKMSVIENPNLVLRFLIFRMDFSMHEWVRVHDLRGADSFFLCIRGFEQFSYMLCCSKRS